MEPVDERREALVEAVAREIRLRGLTGPAVHFLEASRPYRPLGAPGSKKLDPSLASAGRQYPGGPAGFIDSTIPVEEKYRVDVYEDFARAIRRGTKPFVSPEEPLAVMRMIERCRESAGRIVRTPAHPPSAA